MVQTDSHWEPKLAKFDRAYGQPTSIHHWQLKDLVSFHNNKLYTVYQNSTVAFDIDNLKSSVVQKLDFFPNCMTVGHGYIAAGGPTSQLDIRSLVDNQTIYSNSLGNTVNNSLVITDGPKGLLLFACNNDETIKIFSLPSMESYNTLRFPVPINYCALTKGCEYLVAVGDSSITYLCQATPTGFTQIAHLKDYQDVGMSCAWDSQGARFAAASQAGSTCIWDRRCKHLIAKLQTESACRNVKFSSTPMDLLSFTEDRYQCHLIDARNLSNRQTLKLDMEEGTDISGQCFSPDARCLYVGTTSSGIHAFNIDTVARRRFSEGSLI